MAAEFSLNTQMFLLSKKTLWLSDGSMGFGQESDVAFSEGMIVHRSCTFNLCSTLSGSCCCQNKIGVRACACCTKLLDKALLAQPQSYAKCSSLTSLGVNCVHCSQVMSYMVGWWWIQCRIWVIPSTVASRRFSCAQELMDMYPNIIHPTLNMAALLILHPFCTGLRLW